MTCHVAMQGGGGALMISDSQASDATSEYHGVQKLFAGSDFLLGGTGSMDIINALFEALSVANPPVENAESFVTDFVTQEVNESVWGQVEFILTLSNVIKHYSPGIFKRFRTRGRFFSVGSGSQFVNRALMRDQNLGIIVSSPVFVDCAVTAEAYIDAANESLTVNDRLMIGFVIGGKSYLMGDRLISPRFVAPALAAKWMEVAERFEVILAMIRTIRGEFEEAQRQHSAIRVGGLDMPQIQRIGIANDSIKQHRMLLTQELAKYAVWYDDIVRPATASVFASSPP